MDGKTWMNKLNLANEIKQKRKGLSDFFSNSQEKYRHETE